MSNQSEAPAKTDSALEIIDLGDAKKETKQVWFGPHPDSAFGHGAFPDGKDSA